MAVALAVATFLNSLGNGFVFDDQELIVENLQIRRLTEIPHLFASPYWANQEMDRLYRPLVMATYALNYAVGGLSPFGYHLVNVLIHGGNSALVYLLLWSLFQNGALALIAAAAFAVHPIHTEAVANVAGRAELLASAGLLGAWVLALCANEAPRWRRAGYLACSVGAFVAALLSKEHAVVLLGLLVLSDLLRHIRGTGGLTGVKRTLVISVRRIYPVYLATFAVYLLVRFLALGTIMRMAPYSHNNPLLAVEWPIRMLTAIAVLGRYCWLLMVPLRLSADYSHAQIPLTRSPLEVGVLLPALGLLAVAVVAGAVWRRQPVFAFGLLFSLVAIAPAANIFFPIGTIMGERLLYLPSLGFCLWLAACATGLYVLLPRQGAGRAALLVACASILVFYIGRSIVRNRDWQAPLTLWQATVQTSPRSAKAHYNLGDALFTQGDLNGAEREMRAVLQIDPGSGKAYNELGLTLMQQGRSGEALATFEAALRIWPEFAPLHLNLGRFYEQRGMASLALREYQLAAAYAPSIPALGFQLALASDLFVRGDLVTVERLLRRVVRDHPFSAEAQFNLGTVYRKQGMLPEAVTAFQEAVRLKPQYPKAHYALGVVLDLQGRSQEAQRAFEDAKRQWKPAPSGERQ